jgi:type III pantothenate kinase
MSLLFCVDAGNTRIKWAWVAADGIVTGANAAATADVLTNPACLPVVSESVVACNVAGAGVAAVLVERYPHIRWVGACSKAAGVTNHYTTPTQLGVDRFAALIAAHAEPCNQVIVMCGTALTVDALTESGDFLGGVIAPGLTLMRNSLARGTAQLPFAVATVAGLPRSTDAAIGTGTLLAAEGVVLQMAARMSAAGHAPQRFVVSGGGALELLDQLKHHPIVHRPHLVLQGLARAARFDER